MGKRGPKKKGVGTASGSVTLREESSWKKQSHVNAKSMLKLDHIKDLAIWASGEVSISSLGAFFGQRLATSAEALGVPPDPSLFTCQRCESILQVGCNCTVRIEKNKRKAQNRRKPGIPPKNSIVYECHFCSHRNLKKGTPRGYMKQLYPSKPTIRIDPTKSANRKSDLLDTSEVSVDKASVKDPTKSETRKSEELDNSVASTEKHNKAGAVVSSEVVGDDHMASPAASSSTNTVTSLLDSKMRKRNRKGSKKIVEPQDSASTAGGEKTIPTSSKRKRKSWTSLKEIAENESSDSRKFSSLPVPFSL